MKKRHVHIITENEAAAFRVFWGRLGMQAAIMESQGYSKAQRRRYLVNVCTSSNRAGINEGAFDELGGAVEWLSNNGMFQGLQKMVATTIADPLASLLGIPKDGFMYKTFVNFIENLDAATLKEVISGHPCDALATKFAGAVQESIVEMIAQQMGIGQGPLSGAVREGMQAAFVEGGPFVKKFSAVICTFDFESILPGMGKPEEIASKAAAAQGTQVPPKAAAQLTPKPAEGAEVTAPAKA